MQYPAGTAAAGEPSPATRWFFAEGSTGDYFDTFIAVANPAPDPLPITARVYLADGSTSGAPLTFSQVVAPNARATIWLDTITTDEGVSLANQNGVSVEVEGTHPFVAERAMWWAGLPTQWYEGHAAAGFSEPPRAQWRLAGGVVQVPPAGLESSSETYVLVANVGATVADVRVRVFFTDRDPIEIPLPIAPFSRETLPLSPALIAAGVPEGVHDIGIRVDGLNGAELYVEQAVYSTPPGGPHWAAGAAHRATP